MRAGFDITGILRRTVLLRACELRAVLDGNYYIKNYIYERTCKKRVVNRPGYYIKNYMSKTAGGLADTLTDAGVKIVLVLSAKALLNLHRQLCGTYRQGTENIMK